MRVKNSRFHCPSYCFSKPLPPRPPPPQTPSPPSPPVQCQPHTLETKDSHYHTSSKSFPGALEEKLCDEKVEIGENGVDERKREFVLKSSLKKTSASASKDAVRECVKWMDDLGEELVEIREFEPMYDS